MKLYDYKCGSVRRDLLIVLGVMGALILSAIGLVPWVASAILDAHITPQLNSGKKIVSTVAAAGWPKSGDRSMWQNSTHYFAALMGTNLSGLNYSDFGGSGTGAREARDRDEFVDVEFRNIWCITLDAENALPRTPVLFTQNFSFSSNKLSSATGMNSDADPWGDQRGIVIFRDGSGTIMHGRDARVTLNTTSTNTFLWPAGQGQRVRSSAP